MCPFMQVSPMTRLIVDHNVGVSTVGVYEVKKIDADFFTEG
jgi:restriction endonuclease Mrr